MRASGWLLTLWLVMLGVGCSDNGDGAGGSGGTAASQGGSTASQGGSTTNQGGGAGASQTGGSNSNPGGPLFTQAPDCDHDVTKLEGTFQGATVAQDGSLGPNTLTALTYYTVDGGSRSSLRLQWQNALEPKVAQPLSGGYLLTNWDAENSNVLYCIVAGEIGGVSTDREQDDYFKFSITRVRAGEVGQTQFAVPARCDGAEIDVDLKGCVYRYAN